MKRPSTETGLALGRAGALALAGAIEGLLLAESPVIERYAALRIGTEGLLIDINLLCVVALALAGALAALAPWVQAIFVSGLVAIATWSLAEASQHPFWIFSNSGVWRPRDPPAGVLAGHVIAIALVCSAALAEALQAYRAAARQQSFAVADLARDTRRLAFAGGLLLAVAAFVALPLVALLDGLAEAITGTLRGRVALTVLMTSGILLLVGLGLLARPPAQDASNDGH